MPIPSAAPDLRRRLAAEALGTLLLVAGVVGSGIMAQHLTADGALALLCNAVATAALLVVLILVFAPVSGAHFNPALTLALWVRREIGAGEALLYGMAQILGGVAGTALAHAMFSLPLFAAGTHMRSGSGQWLAEGVATFGLLLTIFGCRGGGHRVVAAAVGLYIGAAYWFTASTSFANPAVTIARALTPTFAGIRPIDAPGFIAAQCIAAILAAVVGRWLLAGDASVKAIVRRDL
jgi:glycerol uptake facilitator-like aquaporin